MIIEVIGCLAMCDLIDDVNYHVIIKSRCFTLLRGIINSCKMLGYLMINIQSRVRQGNETLKYQKHKIHSICTIQLQRHQAVQLLDRKDANHRTNHDADAQRW